MIKMRETPERNLDKANWTVSNYINLVHKKFIFHFPHVHVIAVMFCQYQTFPFPKGTSTKNTSFCARGQSLRNALIAGLFEIHA